MAKTVHQVSRTVGSVCGLEPKTALAVEIMMDNLERLPRRAGEMVDNLDYADERSSQRDLEDDEPSSSPAESFSKLKHAEDNTLAVGAFLKHRHDKVWPTGSAKITPTSKDDDKGYIKRLKARRVLMHPTLDC
ncbi:Zn(II)2Cys6 transcription factor [Lasiodiplodia theobromae]|uniref:Zn(II)2Cys6 transcription factor n=1 Tax=Lasiodiplodia theobromae TaxID=45133 RepID=UPI0015C326A4|nr:Zn(II)2Cys6 transcription factor [Lasiodiplodia theobromae]KAF4544259.1 Zn(II)2Cys6 transcription factor [Lasiodiplodia theobromae]